MNIFEVLLCRARSERSVIRGKAIKFPLEAKGLLSMIFSTDVGTNSFELMRYE